MSPRKIFKFKVPNLGTATQISIAILGFVFIYLKVQGIIDWNWLIVTLPFWWPALYFGSIIAFVLVAWVVYISALLVCLILGALGKICDFIRRY